MRAWIRAGALLAPPEARSMVDALVERVHARREEVVRVIPKGLRAGWFALPRAIEPPRGVQVQDATVRPAGGAPKRMRVPLRPYQTAGVKAWRAAGGGTLVMPCGAGKTTTGLAIIGETPTPALVLVHRWDLATQWVERARDQLGLVMELVLAPGQRARLAVATFQQLCVWSSADRAQLGARFGLLVIDEAHHVPARTWGEVLGDLPARHRLALTATPVRHDDKTPILYAHCGGVVHEVEIAHLEELGATLAPVVVQIRTSWRPPTGDDAGDAIVTARGRNGKIVRLVAAAAAVGRRTLVLVDRVEHAEGLGAALRRKGVRADHVVGALLPVERAQRLDGLRHGALQALVATSVADEGLDLPQIDTVILATSTRALGRVQQRIGRALRPSGGKGAPIVYDLVDAGANARDAWKRRQGLYAELGWAVRPQDEVEVAVAPPSGTRPGGRVAGRQVARVARVKR